MPTSATILQTLSSLARDLVWLAVIWHGLVLAAVVLVIMGLRLSSRAAILLLTLPSLSVSVATFAYGLVFNGIAFGLLGLAFAALCLAHERPPLQPGPTWARVLGAALLAFGWAYPHFDVGPWHRTLYAAPLGVLPCPTLAVLAAAALFADGLHSRAACSLLGAWCAFYATFGVLRLGVLIDLGLVLGAVGLVVLAARRRPRSDVRREQEAPPARFRAGLSGP